MARENSLNVRLSERSSALINEYSEEVGLTKSEIIRLYIDTLEDEIKEVKQQRKDGKRF